MKLATNDTIAAIVTPPGEGGVGIVRLSGPQARAIGTALVQVAPSEAGWPSHRLTYGHVIDRTARRRIDEVLAVYLAAPRTYTAEDTFEIHCHGGATPLHAVLDLALRSGARLAERGEFSLRAFLNGRLDLSQAEAVLDVVRARTPSALYVAVEQLSGRLSRHLRPINDRLLGVLAYLEASIDFVEEGIPEQRATELLAQLTAAAADLRALLATARNGIVLREGLRVVLAGAPNVGKSSLLNRLLGIDRAIVTPIAGTTRDTVEEEATIGELPVHLVDTAGLTESADLVEQLGVERSRAAITSAGLLLLVADRSRPFAAPDRAAFLGARRLAPATPALLVLNKADLDAHLDPAALLDLCAPTPPLATVAVSAADGSGLKVLEQAIAAAAFDGALPAPEEAIVDNARHRQALEEALTLLAATEVGMRAEAPLDLVSSDLRAAVRALGTITGQDVDEETLDRIFSAFCVGK